MPELHFQLAINAPPEAVFDRIADFAHYDQWLPPSGMYQSVMELSENPVRLGTTYVDKGTNSVMFGSVTACEPPRRVSFHQVTHFKLLPVIPAGIEVTIVYQVAAAGDGTNLTRDVTVQIKGILRVMQSNLLRGIAAENQRILAALKAACESSA